MMMRNHSITITEDALARVLGPEQPGCVRGRGFGVTLKTPEAQGLITTWRKKNGRGAATTQIMEKANGGDAGFKFYS
ncbi:hypothetical protein TIFTF001_039190 [Ficus carica]|uniref:Uncharacterized protein n=1 Tax=Ficus carica TaxID=3494 RepID=A0AA88E8N9_FICCA|nr:hypothetical protein TIFTF001_039190 [Ficus carica]